VHVEEVTQTSIESRTSISERQSRARDNFAGDAEQKLKAVLVYTLTVLLAGCLLLLVLSRKVFSVARRAIMLIPQLARWVARLSCRLWRLAHVLAHDVQQAVLQRSAPNLVDIRSISTSDSTGDSGTPSAPTLIPPSSSPASRGSSASADSGSWTSGSAAEADEDENAVMQSQPDQNAHQNASSTSSRQLSRRGHQVTLTIMRHAESEQGVRGTGGTETSGVCRDFDRKLTSRGVRDAEEVASKMYGIGIAPDCVVASASVRTQMTARAVLRRLAVEQQHENDPPSGSVPREVLLCEDMYYAMDAKEMGVVLEKHVVHNVADLERPSCVTSAKHLLVVGHNPGIEALIAELTGRAVAMQPGSAVVLEPARVSSSRRWTRAFLSQTWRVSHTLHP